MSYFFNSRCVTVGAADRNNFIEVFFVDFGNKVTRRVGELVQLPFLFASIPFLGQLVWGLRVSLIAVYEI